jgi:hypothetical protein
VNEVARLIRNRFASQHALPRPNPNDPIPRWLWKRSFRIRNRYYSLEDVVVFQQLWGYHDELLAVKWAGEPWVLLATVQSRGR